MTLGPNFESAHTHALTSKLLIESGEDSTSSLNVVTFYAEKNKPNSAVLHFYPSPVPTRRKLPSR